MSRVASHESPAAFPRSETLPRTAASHADGTEPVDLAVVIETPENVALRLHTAGPASRALAHLIDLVVCYGAAFACILAITILAIMTGNTGLGMGLTLVILFLANWFYFVVSEWWFRGKTIGKYVCGLRVVREGGYPIGFWQALLRNLVRAADNLPFPFGFCLVSMSVTGSRFQRLGDLLAGTMVIREAPFRLPTEPVILERIQPLPRTELGAWTPPTRTLSLIEQFLGRRDVLTYQRGHELAFTLADVLAKRLNYTGDPDAVKKYPMGFLARVFVTFQRQMNDEADSPEAADRKAAAATVSSTTTKTATATSAEAAVRDAGNVANKRTFIHRRRPAWREFTRLLELFESNGRGKKKTPAAAAEFSRLFREVCFDLSLVRSRDWGRGLDGFLNQLVIRGHNIFYRSPPARWSAVWNYLSAGFPRLFRRRAGYFAVAAALFFGSFFATWWIVQTHPPLAASILPAQSLEQMDRMYDDPSDDEETKSDSLLNFGDQRSLMAGFYIYNNVGIALQCFGRGAAFGVGTIYILLSNGIAIGAVFGHLVAGGRGNRLLTFVLSHGSFELTAIAVSGGAGLMLGDALLRPGNRRLIDSLKHRGWEAVQIAMGAAVMLVIAAFIEAFWSPSALPQGIKLSGGAAFWLLVAAYLGLAGRRPGEAAGGPNSAN